MSELNTVFFVSVIRTPNDMATSTHIMTNSLLKGLKEIGITVYFFAICENHNKVDDVLSYYSNMVDKVIPLKSVHGEINGRFTQIFETVKGHFLKHKYRKSILDTIDFAQIPDLIISHSPSYEAIFYAKELKKYYKSTLYEYWSDPLALSGINPENFNYKRWIHYLLEKKSFQYADRIIYGTKTLMQFQQMLYKRYRDKMFYIDIPYVNEPMELTASDKRRIIYAGNYTKAIRNIVPLANAVSNSENFTLDVYGSGDSDLSGFNHVTVHGRVTPQELSKIERQYRVVVCILNSSCIQIPGKVFYGINNDTDILVIADGKHRKQLIEYLQSYKRFVLCENTQESILDALNKKMNLKIDMDYIHSNFSPQKIAADLIGGGLK